MSRKVKGKRVEQSRAEEGFERDYRLPKLISVHSLIYQSTSNKFCFFFFSLSHARTSSLSILLWYLMISIAILKTSPSSCSSPLLLLFHLLHLFLLLFFSFRLSRCTWMEEAQMTLVRSTPFPFPLPLLLHHTIAPMTSSTFFRFLVFR